MFDLNHVSVTQADEVVAFGTKLAVMQSGKSWYECSLDLHHHTLDEAQEVVWDFIEQCYLEGMQYVRIIHGRGLRMKTMTVHWLKQMDETEAFCTAHKSQGGVGATIIRLKHKPPKEVREEYVDPSFAFFEKLWCK